MKMRVIAALAGIVLLTGCASTESIGQPTSSNTKTPVAAATEPEGPEVIEETRESGTPYMWASKMSFPTADLRIAVKAWIEDCDTARTSDACKKILGEIETGATGLSLELADNFGYLPPTGGLADLYANTVTNVKTLEKVALAVLEKCESATEDCTAQLERLSSATTEFLVLDEGWRGLFDTLETPTESEAPRDLLTQVETAFAASYGSGDDATYPVILSFSGIDAPRITVAVDMYPKAENEPEALGVCRAVLSIRDQVTAPFSGVYVTAGEGGPFLAECDNPDY